jgi:hypothetical protein
MRNTFAEDLSPQGPVVAFDELNAMLEEIRRAVMGALWRPDAGSAWLTFAEPTLGSEWLVAELEAAFEVVEHLARTASPGRQEWLRVIREMRALLWAMLPIELYPAASALLRKAGAWSTN